MRFLRYLSTYHSAVCSLTWLVTLTIIMGIVGEQTLLSAWYIALTFTWMMISLGLAILRVCRNCLAQKNKGKALLGRLPFFVNHIGLGVAIVAATLGSTNLQRLQMLCYIDRPEWRGVDYDNGGSVVELPFAVELHEFTMEEYEDGMPKRFVSDVSVFPRENTEAQTAGKIEVNKPLDVDGWKIYQSGYDYQLGKYSPYSIFDVVKDPWLPAVYVGIYLLLTGAVVMIIQTAKAKRTRGHTITVVAIALAFAVMAYFFVPVMTNKQLMPALQSPWFVPHVLVYMFAYTLLAATVLLAGVEYVMRRRKTTILPIIDNLVYAGTALVSIGMLFGALWAKEAWGHYWTWDPKETWAAITWFAYLIYIHYRKLSPKSHVIPLLILVVAFVLLNMCWWGINYLPSAQGMSVHLYS